MISNGVSTPVAGKVPEVVPLLVAWALTGVATARNSDKEKMKPKICFIDQGYHNLEQISKLFKITAEES